MTGKNHKSYWKGIINTVVLRIFVFRYARLGEPACNEKEPMCLALHALQAVKGEVEGVKLVYGVPTRATAVYVDKGPAGSNQHRIEHSGSLELMRAAHFVFRGIEEASMPLGIPGSPAEAAENARSAAEARRVNSYWRKF